MRSETFDHEAGIGVAGEGASLEEAFAGAARAMFGVMVGLDGVEPRTTVQVAASAPDREMLLVSWLNALLAEADLRGLFFCEFAVRFFNQSLLCEARGEPFDPERREGGVEVKGATLTQLSVARRNGLWRAQTVVDV